MSKRIEATTTEEKTTSPTSPTHTIPPSFLPGDKIGKDGTIFRKAPERELFDRRWREAVARGEDPTQNLKRQVDSTGTSSFIEYWWRKARGKGKTRVLENLAVERREGEEVEGGTAGLLGGEGWEREREREEEGGGGEGEE